MAYQDFEQENSVLDKMENQRLKSDENGVQNFALAEKNMMNDGIYDKINNNDDEWHEDGGANVQMNVKNSRNHKVMFLVLVILGFGTLGYAFLNLFHSISSPFLAQQQNTVVNTTNSTITEQALVDKKNIDTDQDGLSDFDEEFVYGTSPYLADTDSDGYTDKQEIDSEHDPLCPTGENCRAIDTTTVTTVENIIASPLDIENLNQGSAVTTTVDLTDEEKAQLKQLTVAQVRELLLSSGQMTEEQLNQIDDTTLMRVFQESLK